MLFTAALYNVFFSLIRLLGVRFLFKLVRAPFDCPDNVFFVSLNLMCKKMWYIKFIL
jgi:hypothetical protein